MHSAAYAQYRQTAVQTASPGNLVLMLYDGCIRYTRTAAQHLSEQRLDQAAYWTGRSQDILVECLNSLDAKAGEVSSSLAALYEYFHFRLSQGLVKKDVSAYEEVAERLSDLRSAWAEILQAGQAVAAAGPAPRALLGQA